MDDIKSIQQNSIKNESEDNDFAFPRMPLTREPMLISATPKYEVVLGEAEDMKSKLQMVIEENTALKETLHQNNLTMKQQFRTLGFWQEDVLKVHHKHLKRFEETKEHTRKLIDEINSLKNEMNTVRNVNADLSLTVEQLKHEKDDLMRSNSSSDTKKPAREEVRMKDFRYETKQFQQLLEGEKDKVKFLEKKIREYERLTLRDNRRRLVPVSHETSKEEELNALVDMLHKRLEESERAKRQLEFDLEKLTSYKGKLELRLIENQSANNRALIDFKIDKQLWKTTEDFLGVEFPSLDIDTPDTVETLKKQLGEEKLKVEKAKELLQLNQEQLCLMVGSVNSFLKAKDDLESQAGSSTGLQEVIDALTSKVSALEKEVKDKNEMINTLKIKIKELEAENESVEILKSQILVYRSEFNVERKCREDLVAEREKLLTDMRLLMQQNKLLTERQQQIWTTNSEDREGRPPLSHSAPSTGLTEEIPSEGLICPNPECSKRFDALHDLQLHVEVCLKLTD